MCCKKRTRRKGRDGSGWWYTYRKTSEPLKNALVVRVLGGRGSKVVLGVVHPSEPWENALVVRVWGALGGLLRRPPKGDPRTENHF